MNIPRDYQDNYGGLNQIMYALAEDLQGVMDQWDIRLGFGSINIPQATLDNHFHSLQPIVESAGYQEPDSTDENGKTYRPSVGCRFNRDRSDIRDHLNSVLNKGVVLYVVDMNGTGKLLGSPDEPLYERSDFRSGEKAMDSNSYTLYIEGVTTIRSPEVTIV